MKYIVKYDNGWDYEDYYQYNFLIDGDSIESVRQKVVDAFAEAINTDHFDMIIDGYLYPIDGYLYPLPYLGEERTVDLLDFEVITVEDYLKNHMPEKAYETIII
ncbi:MAG: hypothetical protein IM509_05515 [Microcystis sp. M31BS1]|uniref:hypothetical protein n=1 Tax=Microcystis sp. M31BS1 TaxID=2771186 RepID=UPI00258372CA|nr:hypothetical protein [Microcystis sp. M31BS1]MCA2590209.1 hypothetical protein [Microcystis sp. M31BS1]